VTIHVVGKYTGYEDSYKSLNEAVYHGGFAHRANVKLHWVEAEALEKDGGAKLLEGAHAILVPGRLRLARHARHDEGGRIRPRARRAVLRDLLRVPVGHVEFARNVCGLEGPTPPRWTRTRRTSHLQAA
jgi:CTP synthase